MVKDLYLMDNNKYLIKIINYKQLKNKKNPPTILLLRYGWGEIIAYCYF